MTDVAIPGRPKAIQLPSGHLIAAAAIIIALMLLFHFLASINWSAVTSKTQRCELHRGAFNASFSSGFDVDRWRCPAESDPMLVGIP